MKIRLIAAIALWAGLSTAAVAQVPTYYSLVDSASNTFQVGAFKNSINSKIFPGSVSVDASGNPMAGPAGSTNPQSQALYVQGVTGGVPLYVTFPTAQHIICDSGCSAGGGGLSVPYGGAIGANGTPGGFKDGGGNFQAFLGDVTNGQHVSVQGTLPAFAATPTFNIGTAPTIAVTGTFFQATQPISAASLPLPTGAATQTTLASILTALGTPFQAGGSIGNTTFAVTQATAASLNATVVGTGTFAVQATQSGTWNIGSITTLPALVAGSAIIGNVRIDQTTVGTTNGISIAEIGATAVATGNGVSGAGSQRVNIASDNTAFSVNATLQASATTAIGKVDPNTIGLWGLAASTQNGTTPTNGHLMMGQFNTAPTTITTGNISPLQMDNAGNLLVNIKAGASSGAVAQGSTTSGQTGGLTQAAVTTSSPSYTTGQTSPLSLTLAGALRVDASATTQPVSVASLPLPSGAATAANQSTEISSLSTIATNTGGPVPLNVNTTTTAQTGLTPGTAQTGTIVAANTDQTSLGGVAYGAMANFGASPGAVKAPNSNAFNFVTDQVGGGIAALEGDPCQTTAKSYLPITATTSLVKVIATGVASKKIYVCQILLTVTSADNVAVFEATTGTTCATSPVAVIGAGTSVATAANGFPFPANGGVSLGNGSAMVAQTTVNNNDLCIGTSAATPLAGGITYVTR